MFPKVDNKHLYEGKYFYEIVKPKTGGIQLFGPFDNIYYATTIGDEESNFKIKYVQVIDDKPVAAFTEEEILVTDRKL